MYNEPGGNVDSQVLTVLRLAYTILIMLLCGFSGTYDNSEGGPGDYSPPWGGWVGINTHGEQAVVKQVQRAEQLTADRDRISFEAVGIMKTNERDVLSLFFVWEGKFV